MVPEANPVSAVSSCMTVHVHAYACENGMYNVYVCACGGGGRVVSCICYMWQAVTFSLHKFTLE